MMPMMSKERSKDGGNADDRQLKQEEEKNREGLVRCKMVGC